MATRRRFFLSSAAAALSVGLPAGAHAFRRVEPNQDVQRIYQGVCASSRYHEEIVDRVVRDLADQGIQIGEPDVRTILAVRTCPLCGCSVAARTRPPSEAGE